MASATWPRSLCVTLGLLAASSEAFFQEEGGGGPAGACKFILHELVKVSERTCFDELPKFLCCHQPPSIGCFKDQAHRDLCCEGPFSQKVLAQDYLIGLVMQKQDVLQRNCPFAAALTQLMPYQIEDLRLNKKTLFDHELTWLARAMSFAGAGWSNLLQNKWPVFGILRRIRDHLLRTEPKTDISDIYYQQLETAPTKASQVGKALSRLNVTEDCMAGVTARLHLALLSETGEEFPSSPSAQLVEEAELLAVRCHRKLLPRLRGLLMSPAPVLTLLHEIWRKLRPKGWKHLAQQAKVRQPTSLTVNACLCELEWEMDMGDATSFRCDGNLGCCDPYGNGDFFCKTQPGCYQAYDSCFPRKSKIGGPGLDFLVDAQKDFLNHKLQAGSNDDLMKCRQIAKAIEGMPLETKVLDVGAGTAPCKPIIRSLGYAYTAQDAKEYVGTEAIAGSVFLHGYADIDIVSDIADMPLPNNSFNIIVCTDVLEHVLRPREAVHEMGRLLKTGGMAFIQVPFGGALHNLPHHYYAGFTHFWFEKMAAEAGLQAAWGYHFETMGKRIQRSLQSEECLSGLFGGSSAAAWRHHATVDLPNILEHLRSCQSSPEGAVDQAFPSGIRAVLIKAEKGVDEKLDI